MTDSDFRADQIFVKSRRVWAIGTQVQFHFYEFEALQFVNGSLEWYLYIMMKSFTLAVSSQYTADWASINSRPIPAWYDQVKFGIFIHWGAYSVPAYGNGTTSEWYWYYLNTKLDGGAVSAYHNKSYGPDFTYQEFGPKFTAHLYDPDQWASIFKQSGAKYVVLTSKHHEGFTMWDSPQSWGWNAVDVGPRMDVVEMLTKSVKAAGLHMGLYFSQFEWFNPLYLADAASGSPPTTQDYVNSVSFPQMFDIVNRYEPEVIWSDGEWLQPSEYWRSTEFLAWLYSNSTVKDSVVVNDRWGSETRNVDGGFWTGGDKMNPGHLIDHKWENCNTMGYSWGYNQNEDISDYQSTAELLQELVTTVSCGGNLLLDVGPTHEGVIPIIMQDRLRSIGEWFDVNGESIYDTNPWRVQNDSLTLWYTTNVQTGAVYATTFEWPVDGYVSLVSPVASDETVVQLLGVPGNLDFTYAAEGLNVKLPVLTPSQYPPHETYVLRLMSVK
eukprot:gene7929-9317_t